MIQFSSRCFLCSKYRVECPYFIHRRGDVNGKLPGIIEKTKDKVLTSTENTKTVKVIDIANGDVLKSVEKYCRWSRLLKYIRATS